MQPKRKYRLLWIRGLMIASQALLILLIASWLQVQYDNERKALKAELNNTFDAARQKISDSLIYAQFIKPIVKNVKFSGNVNVNYKVGSSPAGKHIIIKTNDTKTSKKDMDSLLKNLEKGLARLGSSIDTHKLKMNKPAAGIEPPLAEADTGKMSQSAKKAFGQIMTKVFSQIIEKDDSAGIYAQVSMDTAKLHQLYARKLHEKGLHFNIRWINGWGEYDEAPAHMIAETEFYSKKYYAVVSDIRPYLIKKISPQIFFTLFLVLLTSLAYIITYRTMNEQVRLGRIKNEFISNMSHELKTPISTVKVALEALTSFNMIENPAISREYLEMAAQEMNRLDMLVNQSLNAALLEEGKIVLRKEKEDLKRIVEDTITVLRIRIQKHEATVASIIEGTDFQMLADRLHLQGVLVNLIDNSMKYGGKGTKVQVHLRENGGNIVLSVSDNGPGIPKEYISKIFDKFFRVPSGDRHNVKGYGLGLSYAKQIVEQHDGQISVSNNTNGGCTFTLTFPKAY